MRSTIRVLVAGIIFTSLFAFTPTSQAAIQVDPTTWINGSLASLTGAGAFTHINIDRVDGTEKVGLLYLNGANIGFLRCDDNCHSSANWVAKTLDATGAVGVGIAIRMAWIGGDDWAFAYANGGGSGATFDLWSSQDDGATWTLTGDETVCGGTNCYVNEVHGSGVPGYIDVILTATVSVPSVFYRHSGNYGATFPLTSRLNDNRGGDTGTATWFAAAQGSMIYAEDSITNPFAVAVVFQDTVGRLFNVETSDGIFWTTPYDTEGGSTIDPVLPGANCPTEATQPVGNSAVGFGGFTGGNTVTVFPRKTGASLTYQCSLSEDVVASAYPNTAPATAVENNGGGAQTSPFGGRGIVASNGFQFLTAVKEGTTNNLLYRPTADDPWSVVYSGAFNTYEYGLTATDTHAYFAYTDGTAGGRLTLGGATMIPGSPTSNSFCPNPLELPDYGYTYRREGDFFQDGDNPAGIGLSSGYEYTGATAESTWAYSAKGLNTGSKALHTNITIEAGTDGGTSTFRVAFNTISGNTPSVSTKGDGLTTGNFADHGEAQFQENGNTWQVSLWYVSAGGARTQLGSAFNYGNSNDATPFVVWMDDRSSANGPLDPVSGTVTAGPYLAVTAPGSSIPGFRALPFDFTDDVIYDVWYIGSGGSLAATTALDENQQVGDDTSDEGGHDSTCIFDDVGVAFFEGSQGLTPESEVPPLTPTPTPTSGNCALFCVDSTTVPEGFTSSTFNLFLGVLLMLSVAAGLYFTTKSPLMGGVGGVGGFLIGFAFGLFPLWIIVVLVVLAVAVIFIRVKGAASG